MSTLTIRLPDATAQRLKQLAASRGISLSKLMEELSVNVLAEHDAESRFRAAAANADQRKASDTLARLDAAEEIASH